MNMVSNILLKHQLPLPEKHAIFVDYCSNTPLYETTFPNSKLDMTTTTEHLLTAYNAEGIGEALEVLELELDNTYYSPTSQEDKKYQELVQTDPIELRRYSSAIVNNKIFTEFSEELAEEFIKTKKAYLQTHHISGDYSYIFIKTFI